MTSAGSPGTRRHRRRRVRRRRLCPQAGRDQGPPRHPHRQERLPPVPAAPVPGRDVDAGGDDIAYPLRKIAAEFEEFDTKRAEVVAIDPVARTVTTRHGETYTGDYLVLAAGSQPNFFRTPGAEHAFPLYSLDDADRLKTRIIQAFEEADSDPQPRRRGRHRLRHRRRGADGGGGRGRPVRDDQHDDGPRVPGARAAGQGPSRRPRHGAPQDVRRQGPRLRGADPREGRRRAAHGRRREGHRTRSRDPVGRERRSRPAASSGAAA